MQKRPAPLESSSGWSIDMFRVFTVTRWYHHSLPPIHTLRARHLAASALVERRVERPQLSAAPHLVAWGGNELVFQMIVLFQDYHDNMPIISISITAIPSRGVCGGSVKEILAPFVFSLFLDPGGLAQMPLAVGTLGGY